MQAPKEGCMAPLTFFCITSSVDFTFLPTLVVSLQLPPAIQKQNYREASATESTGSPFLLDHGLAQWPSVFSTRILTCRRNILWESISELFCHNHFFSPLWDCTTKHLVPDWKQICTFMYHWIWERYKFLSYPSGTYIKTQVAFKDILNLLIIAWWNVPDLYHSTERIIAGPTIECFQIIKSLIEKETFLSFCSAETQTCRNHSLCLAYFLTLLE